MKKKKEKTIERKKLDPISMSVNHRLPNIVNDNGRIMEYVGIGWIDVTDKNHYDRNKIPKVVG